MVLQPVFRGLSTKRSGYYVNIMQTLIKVNGVPSSFRLICGSGNSDLPLTAEGIESPIALTRDHLDYFGDHIGNAILTIGETFTNNTGDTVTVREIGIKYGTDNNNTYCCTREILANPVTLANGESHSFRASLRISENTFGYFNNLYSLIRDSQMTDFDGTIRKMDDVSRKSDIVPIGTWDDWGGNDTRVGYGSGRAWWIDVGFSDTPVSTSDLNLGDANRDRIDEGRTDVLTVSNMAYVTDSSYFDMIHIKALFTNNTGSALTVKEKGLLYKSGYYDNYRYYLMTRQVLDTPIVIPAGLSVEIDCAIKFSDV